MTDARFPFAFGEIVVSTAPPENKLLAAYAEVIVLYRAPTPMDVYPSLPGLAFSVTRTPKFSTGKSVAASGREVRIGYYSAPLWEWKLRYTYLPNFQGNGATQSDYQTLLGFFASHFGALQGFYFEDPDDNTVVGQNTGTGDGVTRLFQIQRTYGLTYTTTEYIGGLNPSNPINVYLDGVLQVLGIDYTRVTTVPGQQYLNFLSPPANGAVITIDMSYYFYVRFAEDTSDFDEFMRNFWQNESIVLTSLRG